MYFRSIVFNFRGDFQIDELVAVDEGNGFLYILGTDSSPLDKTLYRISLENGSYERYQKKKKMGVKIVVISIYEHS